MDMDTGIHATMLYSWYLVDVTDAELQKRREAWQHDNHVGGPLRC